MRVGDVVDTLFELGIVAQVDVTTDTCWIAYECGVVEQDSVLMIESVYENVLNLTRRQRAIVNASIAAEALRRIG